MKQLMVLVKYLDRVLAYSQRSILIIGSITVITTISLEVVTRYCFGAPIWGMEEMTGHTAVWLYMIGAAYGTFDRSHIKAEFIHLIIKNPRILRMFRVLTTCISTVVCCFMIVWSYNYVQWSLMRHEVTPALRWPTVYFQISILIGFILMAVYFVVETVDLIRTPYVQRVEE